jgi:multisubunit Na+/H+ antiporter MnhB subunit
MQVADWFMDGLLGLSVLGLGWLLLGSRDFIRTAVLFVVLGIFMSLAWVRLRAPDIALAEAAIGAGVTGVLLMDAIRHMEWGRKAWGEQWTLHAARRPRLRWLSQAWKLAAALLLMGLLMAGVGHLAGRQPGLGREVAAHMEPLEHPVTAVLLVFRSLDTWLELGILLLAVIGMLTARARHGLTTFSLTPPQDPVLDGIVRVLTPLAVLCAGYLLWLGTFTAGGAFQSGVVLAAVGILFWLSARPSIEALPEWVWKCLVLLGFVAFTLAAILTLLVAESMLQYPQPWEKLLLEVMEVAAAISIGTCLTALFVGLHPDRQGLNRNNPPPDDHRTGKGSS